MSQEDVRVRCIIFMISVMERQQLATIIGGGKKEEDGCNWCLDA